MLSIRYLGTIIDTQGRRSDPEKVHANVNTPALSNDKMLRSCLVMISCYSHFAPNMLACSIECTVNQEHQIKLE